MKLSDIADVNPPTDTSNLASSEMVSFIPMSDVSDNGRWVGKQRRELAAVRQGYTNFEEGDVLFAKITPCMENGKGCLAVNLTNGIGFGSTEFHVLRAKSGADNRYIFQWTRFQELRQKAANAMTGSAGQQRVPAEFLHQFQIPSHSSDEQSVIANVLETIDKAVEQTEALLAKQRRIKAGLMHDILIRGLNNKGRLRNYDEHKFKPSSFGLIPDEWDIKTLAECVNETITYGIVQAGPHVPGGVPYIRTGDMDGNELTRERLLCTTPAIAERYYRSEVRAGDIVCAIRATVGKVLRVPDDLDGANLTQGTARISPRENVDGGFLLWAIRSSRTQLELSLQCKGTTFPEITLTALRRIPVAVPRSINEQRDIAKRFDDIDGLIVEGNSSLHKLRRLKAGLMQDLLTNRVPVTPLLQEEAMDETNQEVATAR